MCQIIIVNPLQSLKLDLTYQRLLYKIFQHRNLSKSIDVHINTNAYVNLEYWDMSSGVLLDESSRKLSTCYLECLIHTPLSTIQKFLQTKYSLPSTFKVDLFYRSFPLNTDDERLIDVYYCFNLSYQEKIPSLDIRYVISSCGYQAILKRIYQSKHPTQLEVDVPPPTSSSMDSKLKVKLYRSQNSTNDWYIPQSTSLVALPDLVNSCTNQSKLKKSSCKMKPRRRIRFIPTMVRVPPSFFDIYLHEKSICKVSPYIPERSLTIDSLSSFDETSPLDLSLKQMSM
ncbi:unnamed protein product [Adineta ricciae]|nr:unnamed protein product [Adineta ricciae]